MDIAKIRTAVTNIEQGAWVSDIPFDEVGDLALKVRGLFNPDAMRVREQYLSSLSAEEREDLPREKADALAALVLIEAVVEDWNLAADGAPLACTPEARAQVFSDPVIGTVMRAAALYAARNVATKGAQRLEADAKN